MGFLSKLFGGGGNNDLAIQQVQRQQAEEVRKDQLRAQISALFDTPDAMTRFKSEEDELAKSLEGYYGEDLGTRYADTGKALKFGAANTGNIGGSAYADQSSKLERDRSLGGTRIAEAVQRAINQLRTGREDSRLRALQLINTGSGSEALQAATAGMQSSVKAANSGQRERLFDDLFQNLAVGKIGNDRANQSNAAAALFQKKTGGSFFPTNAQNNPGVVRY